MRLADTAWRKGQTTVAMEMEKDKIAHVGKYATKDEKVDGAQGNGKFKAEKREEPKKDAESADGDDDDDAENEKDENKSQKPKQEATADTKDKNDQTQWKKSEKSTDSSWLPSWIPNPWATGEKSDKEKVETKPEKIAKSDLKEDDGKKSQ